MDKLLIGLDFDGTLAFYDDSHNDIEDQLIIPEMYRRVANWIEQGHEVYLFTAKASDGDMIRRLRKWLNDNDLKGIKQITNKKVPGTNYYVDDGALVVDKNIGTMPNDPITDSVQSQLEEIMPRRIRIEKTR
jgi:hydroxymethylpyrimidine pyrophosphatase-like HAD family hydrolase